MAVEIVSPKRITIHLKIDHCTQRFAEVVHFLFLLSLYLLHHTHPHTTLSVPSYNAKAISVLLKTQALTSPNQFLCFFSHKLYLHSIFIFPAEAPIIALI